MLQKFKCILSKQTADMTLHLVTLKMKKLKTFRQKNLQVVKKSQAPIPSLTCERPVRSRELGTSAWPHTRSAQGWAGPHSAGTGNGLGQSHTASHSTVHPAGYWKAGLNTGELIRLSLSE